MSRYKIVLDLNVFRDNNKNSNNLFNDYVISDLTQFLEKNNCKDVLICVARIVVLERIYQVLRANRHTIEEIENHQQNLHTSVSPNFSHRLEMLKDVLTKESEDFIKKWGLYIIEPAPSSVENLLERALNREPPFRKDNKESDQGLKDTLFWLSLLKDAEGKESYYLLCSEDKAFRDKDVLRAEYSKHDSNNNIEIFDTVEEVKAFLDEKLKLELDLKRITATLHDSIGKHIGTIMTSINSKRYNRHLISAFVDKEETAPGFDYRSHTITNFQIISAGKYEITVKLTAETPLAPPQEYFGTLASVGCSSNSLFTYSTAIFTINLVYSDAKGIEEIKDISTLAPFVEFTTPLARGIFRR